MLLVNGFRPVQKNNFRQPTKANSNFTSLQSTTSDVLEKDAIELANKVITKGIAIDYSEILGKNFKEAFIVPLNKFLEEKNLSIQHTNIENFTMISEGYSRSAVASGKNASYAQFTDKDSIRHYTLRPELSVFGVTPNDSKVKLLKEHIGGRLMFGLNNVKIPEALQKVVSRLSDASAELKFHWFDMKCEDGEKVQRLQKAFKILMPEE